MPPLSSRDQLLKRVVVRAATSPLSLFLGTTGLLLVASPPTMLFGLAALGLEAAWLWSRIRDPHSAEVCGEEMQRSRWRDLITRLEDLTGVLDRDTAAALARIVESQERLLGLYAGSGTGAASTALVPHSRTDLTILLQRCLSLAEKKHRLQAYMSTLHTTEVQREATQLQSRVERTHDPVTRQLYEQALEQKRQELENYVQLQQAIERIDGQLAAVQCTFDNMLSKVVRMQSVHALATDAAADPVVSELNRLASGVAALEASLDEALTARGVA